jgi:hypothetical protein
MTDFNGTFDLVAIDQQAGYYDEEYFEEPTEQEDWVEALKEAARRLREMKKEALDAKP